MGPARGSTSWEFAGALSPGGKPPRLDAPEFAFAGRSNVGKSSLINSLTHTRGLARTSRTPGRTQQINFFTGPGPMVFADLPGYGFARAPIEARVEWNRLVDGYLKARSSLRAVVLIVDARRGILDLDRQALATIQPTGRPVVLVASKVDKLRSAERARQLAAIGKEIPDPIPFSALSGEGERELWRRLTGLAALR